MPVSDDELFKVWSLIAAQLAESATLGEGKRQFAQIVFDKIRDAMSQAVALGLTREEVAN